MTPRRIRPIVQKTGQKPVICSTGSIFTEKCRCKLRHMTLLHFRRAER